MKFKNILKKIYIRFFGKPESPPPPVVHAPEYHDNYVAKATLLKTGKLWLNAIATGNYDKFSFSNNLRITHNAKEMAIEEYDIWALTNPRFYTDEQKGHISVYGVIYNKFFPLASVYNARIRIQDGKITEIESISGKGYNSYTQDDIAGIPLSREDMIELAETHLWGLWTGIGSPEIYNSTSSRTENGDGILFHGQVTSYGYETADDMWIYNILFNRIEDRRKVIDVEHNVVVVYCTMRYDIDSINLPIVVRFAMKNGKIQDIEVTWQKFSFQSNSGWKNILNAELGLS